MNYYVSDFHLFHKNVTKEGKDFDNRPFENLEQMHACIKEKWNSKINNGDTVYILGDIAMRGTQEDLIAFVSTLKGRKVLVRGNHDDVKDLRYKQLFDEICDYKEIKDTLNGESVKLVLSHYPILMWKDQHAGTIHLYGHLHNSKEEFYFQKCLKEMNSDVFFDRRAGNKMLKAYNVGCMMPYMDYVPRTLSEIVEGFEKYENNLQ